MKKNQLFILGTIVVLALIVVTIFILSHAHNNPVGVNLGNTNSMTIGQNGSTSTSQASSSTYPPIQGEYHVNLPNQLMLVDSQGRRTGEDPATGVVYREIPNTNYGDLGTAGELFTSNLPSGQYTLYVLGATSTYWLDTDLTGQRGEVFRGSITPGSMIAYTQDYDTANIASSIFSVSSTVSSAASVTTAPPNNWVPPQ